MRFLFNFIFIFCAVNLTAQTIDTTHVRLVKPVKQLGLPIYKAEKISHNTATRIDLFGEYTVESYVAISKKTPNTEELDALSGTIVKVQTSTITGAYIDPITFQIYEVERLQKDDFIFRVFGSGLNSDSLNLPMTFNVHKTDNENCYGIVEIDASHIAIPYKGVLLFLTKK